MKDWILGASTVVLGALLTLAVEWVRRRWASTDAAQAEARALRLESERRKDERQEAAAEEILRLLDAVLDRYRQTRPDHPSSEPDVHDLVAPMQRAAISLSNQGARREMEKALSILGNASLIWAETSTRVTHVVWQINHAAQACLGAMLRGEPIPTSEVLAYYESIVETWWDDNEPSPGKDTPESDPPVN